jgi:ABC-3C biological conflict system middle component
MLLPEDVQPEQSIFFNGAFVLESLLRHGVVSLPDLYLDVHTKRSMPYPVFVLCVDWLYLIGSADIDSAGMVFACF